MQYSVRFLLIVTAIIAVLALCGTFLSQTTFLVSCAVVPASLALTFRYCQRSEHRFAILIALGSAVVIGSLMFACGSYHQTFNKGATGFLIGGGWNSVGAAAIVGAFTGFLCGIIAMLIYLVFTAVIGFPTVRVNQTDE